MSRACNGFVGGATSGVLLSIRSGRCSRTLALRVDKALERCHGKLPAAIVRRANKALSEFEEKCGEYTGRYTTARPYQVDGARPRRRHRKSRH